ncbi:MAG: FliI/YscN family ATPase [Kofleriaceae bacterium]
MTPAARLQELARGWPELAPLGRVLGLAGALVEVALPGAGLGDVLELDAGDEVVPCEVVGFRGATLLAVPLAPPRRLVPGALARRRPAMATVPVGDALIGRVVDPFGVPLDDGPPPAARQRARLSGDALPIALRGQVERRFDTGVRVIDGLLTCGRGQRVGIFAGAGCGKSVLIDQIARQSEADVVVLGLVGERGREVRELMSAVRERPMVIVAATADRSPLERIRGAQAATAIAEHFRDRGDNVLLVVDSLTRYAMALREIGLALDEPAATKGYPPSVFAALPRLLERVAPRAAGGSIAGFFTVLVEGDDLSDPIADAARSLLDAHIVLSRELAGRGHFPAVDVLASASRVADRVARDHAPLAIRCRELLGRRRQAQELQALGAYVPGAAPALDRALELGDQLDGWARQAATESSNHDETMRGLATAVGEAPAR